MIRARLLVVAVALAGLLGLAATAAGQDTISATCTAGGQTAPCTSNWYSSPVTVSWQTDSLASSTSPCALGIATTYSQDQSGQLMCTATFPDGSSDTRTLPFHVEVSTPTATATPDRPPDSDGWYNHPVAIAFSGSAFSGIAGCSPTQTYGGPDTPGVAISGSCTDNAGKTAAASIPLRYDATAPAVRFTVRPGRTSITLDWSASSSPAPLHALALTRSPGRGGASSSLLATAQAGRLIDATVRPGISYTYSLTAVDDAGNSAAQSMAAVLTRPRQRVSPLLRWKPARGATYYNLQLYRGAHKVLSVWPRAPRYRLHRSWRYADRRWKLSRGRYRWYVWPGFGPPSRARYGRLVSRGTLLIP